VRSLSDADGHGTGSVPLDLIPAALLLPRVRRVALVALSAALIIGLLVWLVAPWWVALIVGAVLGLPPVLGAFASTRRHLRLQGTTLIASGTAGKRTVELRHLAGVELLVRVGRVSQVVLRVNDGTHGLVSVPLALYTDGGGRELDVLALRSLADALASSELAPAAAIASVLVEQLRAEARGAGLPDRPLHRAITLARDAGRTPQTTLTDQEVASLVD